MDIVAVGLSVCNVDFTWDSGTGEISDIVHTSPCDLTSLPADLSNSSLNAAFAGGAASVTGSVVIDVGFDCHYSTTSLGAVTGTYSDAGSSPVIRSFAGGPQNVQKTGGLFLCPSPLNSLEFQNGTIEL
ncbi:MAG TPA: hypothetical protein VMF31_03820 [Solirubrobacterales bacterium]|nr:hypothetical protein [Solirubrobacterales bacterium]